MNPKDTRTRRDSGKGDSSLSKMFNTQSQNVSSSSLILKKKKEKTGMMACACNANSTEIGKQKEDP